jgi:hypothetical protein
MTKQPRNLGKSGAKDKLTGGWETPRNIQRHESADIDAASSSRLKLFPDVSSSIMFRFLWYQGFVAVGWRCFAERTMALSQTCSSSY